MPRNVTEFSPDDLFDLSYFLSPITNEELWSLIETACAQDNVSEVRDIAQARNLEPSGFFLHGAAVAIERGNEDVVVALVEAGLPVDESIVSAAVRSPHRFQFLPFFLAHGWDVNAPLDIYTPSVLALAAAVDDLKLVKWLLEEQHADVNAESAQLTTPLSSALQSASDAIVDTMLAQDVCVDKGQLMHYALWRALKQPVWDTRIMDWLVQHGVPINKKMYDTDHLTEIIWQMQAIPFGTPLHCAVRAGRKEAVEYLLRHGASPDVPDEQDKTPLQFADGDIRELLQFHQSSKNTEVLSSQLSLTTL